MHLKAGWRKVDRPIIQFRNFKLAPFRRTGPPVTFMTELWAAVTFCVRNLQRSVKKWNFLHRLLFTQKLCPEE